MLGRLWWILAVALVTTARATGFPATCSGDWSVVPGQNVIRCSSTEEVGSPIKCASSSCSSFPICSNCVDTTTQEWRESVTCHKKYSVLDSASPSSIMCVDQDDSAFKCTGDFKGALTCDNCSFDTTRFRVQQLHKRANPMINGMVGPSAANNGFGGINW